MSASSPASVVADPMNPLVKSAKMDENRVVNVEERVEEQYLNDRYNEALSNNRDLPPREVHQHPDLCHTV
jgi:hypothetical protein